jgi:hypothetical protein
MPTSVTDSILARHRARPTGLARLRVRRASGGLFLIVHLK